jgi:hypothetical protein
VLTIISISLTTITNAPQRKLSPQDALIIKFTIHFQSQTNKGVPMEEIISFKHTIQAELHKLAKQIQPF